MYKLALSVLICSYQATLSVAHFGYQSGGFSSSTAPDTGNSYASALHYDGASKVVYIVGSTYWTYWDRISHVNNEIASLSKLEASDCFFAMLTIPVLGDTMNLEYTRRFGKSTVDESCSALAFIPSNDGKSKIVTAGHTAQNGFLTSLRSLGSPVSHVYGFLLNLELKLTERPKVIGGFDIQGKLDGGALMNDHAVQYPIAVAVNPLPENGEEDAVYIVSQSSTSKKKNVVGGNLQQRPDKAAAGGLDQPEYGNHYSVFMQKMVSKSRAEMDFEDEEADLIGFSNSEGGLKETTRADWTEVLSPSISYNDLAIDHELQISDLKYVPLVENSVRSDLLVLVGTTSGYGDAFGGANPNENDEDESFLYKAGFITTFDVNGALKKSTRIELEEEDVHIKGVCFEEGKDYVEFIYLVGETRGLLADNIKAQDLSRDVSGRHSKHAFLMKMNIQTHERVWTRQVGGTLGKDVISYGCAVSPNDDVVYMAGTIADGDRIRLQTTPTVSAGGDDIFVANYDSSNGDTNFVKQIGTSKNDWLARGNGIVTDESGNAIILGNTRGSMMRVRSDEENDSVSLDSRGLSSDIFVFSIEKGTGEMKTISEFFNGEPQGIDVADGDAQLGGMDITAVIIGAMIASITSVYVGYSVVRSRTNDYRANTETINYLEDFKDPDYELHIRNSATGGVHAVYGKTRTRPMQNTSMAQSAIPNTSVDSDVAEVMNETRYMSPRKQAPRIPPKRAFSGSLESMRIDSFARNDSRISMSDSSFADDDDNTHLSFEGNELL